MKEYKESSVLFGLKLMFAILLLCPTFGLSTFYLIAVLWNHFSKILFIDQKDVRIKSGIINIQNQEIKYSKINSVYIKQNWLGRLLNYGTIVITTGNDISNLVFSGVDSPNQIKAEIYKLI